MKKGRKPWINPERKVRETYILQIFDDDGPMELVSSNGEIAWIDGETSARPASRVQALNEVVKRKRNGDFELLGWTPTDNLDDVRLGLSEDYAISLKTVKGWDIQIRKVFRII
jgi:hypothetical protein